jgi:exoribonuclease II
MFDFWKISDEDEKLIIKANLVDSAAFINKDNRLDPNDKASMFNHIRSFNIPDVEISQ